MIRRQRFGLCHRARGVVLFVALLVLIVLGLASVAIVRAVDTATLVSGHLASKHAASVAVDRGIEHAVAALWGPDVVIGDRTRNAPAQNYFACVQGSAGGCAAPGSEIPELPVVLSSASAFAAAGLDAALVPDDAAGHRSVYVIERICLAPGPALASQCNLPAIAAASGSSVEPSGEPAPEPDAYYRVSVKVSGPRHSAAYAQAMVQPPRGASRERRLAWRLVTRE